MVDIFDEISEDLRKERYTRVAKRYWPHVTVVVAIVVLASAGGAYYRQVAQERAAVASQTYFAAQTLRESGQLDEAKARYAQLSDGAEYGYAVLSRLHLAGIAAEEGQPDDAEAHYSAVMNDEAADPLLRNLARLRLLWVLADRGDLARVRAAAAPLLVHADTPFHALARAAIMVSAFQEGNLDEALAQAEAIRTNHPTTVAGRWADIIHSFLQADGAVEVNASGENESAE